MSGSAHSGDKRKLPQTTPGEVQVGYWGNSCMEKVLRHRNELHGLSQTASGEVQVGYWGIPAWKGSSGTGTREMPSLELSPQKWIQCSERVWGWAGQRWVKDPMISGGDFPTSVTIPGFLGVLPQQHPERVTLGTEPPPQTRRVPGVKSLLPCSLSGPALPGIFRKPSWKSSG